MPGTPYSRYAIPLDYPPSRSFSPRYGYSHGRIEQLAAWFSAHTEQYREFLAHMHRLDLSSIPMHMSAGNSVAPAWIGGPIAPFDALALYAMVRKYKPATFLEIGSGMTTCFARQAITDEKIQTRLVSIDPRPRREIDAICDDVIRDGLETCDLAVFDTLKPNDIVFLDGSHRSFMNSDVTVFFIDVMPRLKPGVIVHLHDIVLPWDYPEFFLHWYWNEQYMLAVYMMNAQDRLNPLFPTAWVCRCVELQDQFATPFVDFAAAGVDANWGGAGSMWFTKTA